MPRPCWTPAREPTKTQFCKRTQNLSKTKHFLAKSLFCLVPKRCATLSADRTSAPLEAGLKKPSFAKVQKPETNHPFQSPIAVLPSPQKCTALAADRTSGPLQIMCFTRFKLLGPQTRCVLLYLGRAPSQAILNQAFSSVCCGLSHQTRLVDALAARLLVSKHSRCSGSSNRSLCSGPPNMVGLPSNTLSLTNCIFGHTLSSKSQETTNE